MFITEVRDVRTIKKMFLFSNHVETKDVAIVSVSGLAYENDYYGMAVPRKYCYADGGGRVYGQLTKIIYSGWTLQVMPCAIASAVSFVVVEFSNFTFSNRNRSDRIYCLLNIIGFRGLSFTHSVRNNTDL